jgi:hypothetical protein
VRLNKPASIHERTSAVHGAQVFCLRQHSGGWYLARFEQEAISSVSFALTNAYRAALIRQFDDEMSHVVPKSISHSGSEVPIL